MSRRNRRTRQTREFIPQTKTIPTGSGPNALLASAQILRPHRQLVLYKDAWQDEVWKFYDTLGEFTYALDWLSAAMSRVRLRAARMVPGSDEPEIIEDGPVAEAVQRLAGGVGGQSAMLQAFTVQLQGPGDSFLVGQQENGKETWGVYSKDVIRPKGNQFELEVAKGAWKLLPDESLVVRVWTPDKRYHYLPTSPAKSALGTMREIELYNRHIISTLVSRLAFNGVWLIPQEVTFPVKEEFADAADPFIAELIDIAGKSIENPGNASAAIPLPLKVPAEYIEKFVHLRFADSIGKEIGENREKALIRLSRMLNVPQEVLEGMGNVNHWSAWQLEDSAIKIHISPIAEIICHGLTTGYLRPTLAAAGSTDLLEAAERAQEQENAEEFLVWYDTSELSAKPDLGEKAVQLHDRIVISDAALRRAANFDETDAPNVEEVRQQIVKRLAYNGQAATNAWEILTGTPAPPSPTEGSTAPESEDGTDDENLPSSEGGAGPSIPETRTEVPSGDASLITEVNGAGATIYSA